MSRAGAEPSEERRYKGVRRRRWGKWVSEIRVPGSRERLWLGSFSTPEAAAVAHDTAVFFLHGPGGSRGGFNFPNRVATFAWADLSPPSVQRVASESGMDVDARLAVHAPEAQPRPEVVIVDNTSSWEEGGEHGLYRGEGDELVGGDICFDALEVHIPAQNDYR
ncbi:hypothetical protein OPV22_021427 [Ensete ventricosum]|uniref:AP2/ERF domain-containing protein n=1 Tax=Ensete ventricosum TaxID=4639 RepID=A0AAV8QQ81_ENSVE|nr:hypothetical protein OPV22_021427 [Ensete ventricosum]RWW25774.1 hypothetical protein GW17_00009868 [Ensete ventricosum]RZS09494.1 hypothetical protein BHM03_00040581 [Ensete ventricosum]